LPVITTVFQSCGEKTVVIKKPSRFAPAAGPRPPAVAASQAKAITSYATASYARKAGSDHETQAR
jgi:hypothetical protein